MDLSKTMNNLSLWEVKSYVRKAQNAVLNLSETEARVREATNNEPWGASSTLMATIARGTFNYRDREEICNMLFRRFTEKAANEWRQIYKALQLLEYLVKHGSERFVDDARANVALVSMLKSFHYIDSKGVDQGINVRNRARDVAALLNDENRIRAERRKAKENTKKFEGVSSTSVGAGSYSGSSTYGGYEGRVFGDGGVFGQRTAPEGERVATSAAGSTRTADRGASHAAFDEYEDDNTNFGNQNTNKADDSTTNNVGNANLLDNDDDGDGDDDEFDDFQSAPTPSAPASTTVNTGGNAGNIDLLASLVTPGQPATPAPTTTPAIASTPAKPVDLFGSLLSDAKVSAHKPYTSAAATNTASTSNVSNVSMPNNKNNNYNYSNNINNNNSTQRSNPPPPPKNNNNIVDLLDL